MKRHFNFRVLYADNYSLLYEIKDTKEKQERRNFQLVQLYSKDVQYSNQMKITFKFNVDFAGEPLQQILGLKPEMFLIVWRVQQKIFAEGVS